MIQEGITAEELNKAREGYLQAIKVGRSSDSALTGTLGGLRYLDRTMQWQADFEAKIAALTPDQISAAMRRHLDSKKLIMVGAGDFGSTPDADKKSETVQ